MLAMLPSIVKKGLMAWNTCVMMTIRRTHDDIRSASFAAYAKYAGFLQQECTNAW